MTDHQTQAQRRSAWNAFFKLLEGVRYRGPEPRPSPEEEERMVEEMVRRERQARHEGENRAS
jgi:hypothetical protein